MRPAVLQICSARSLLTAVVLLESAVLTGWLIREYFHFDYKCFLEKLLSTEGFAVERLESDIIVNRTTDGVLRNITDPSSGVVLPASSVVRPTFVPQNGSVMRNQAVVHQKALLADARNRKRNVSPLETIVHEESLATIKSDEDRPVAEIRTRTMKNRLQRKQRKRRKKKIIHVKETADMRSNTTVAEAGREKTKIRTNTKPTRHNLLNATSSPRIQTKLSHRTNARKKPMIEATADTFVIEVYCQECQAYLWILVYRWPNRSTYLEVTIKPDDYASAQFGESLRQFANNMLCVGRALLDTWALLQLGAAIPMLIGIRRDFLCFFTPYMVLKVLFLVVSFVYGATLTVFALLLFALVRAMTWPILLDWVCFAVIMDGVFVLAVLTFLLMLQGCEAMFRAKTYTPKRSFVSVDHGMRAYPGTYVNPDEYADEEGGALP